MTPAANLGSLFWQSLEADKTMMIGIDGAEDGHTRPMTAQLAAHAAPIWFFAAKDEMLCRKLGAASRATATFASRGHDLFAALQGRLCQDTDGAMVERLWSDSVARWYPRGRQDPAAA